MTWTKLINLVHQCNQIGCEDNNFEVTVTSETNPETDLSEYKTYAWIAESSLIFDSGHNLSEPTVDPIIEFKFSLDTALRNKSLTQFSRNPELLVALSVGANADNINRHK